jgi:hypothetical protein
MTTPILRRRAARTARCATALLLGGCGAQDLANTWELDRLRVLAIAAEPAELRPGETTALRSLVYVPTGATFGTGIWIGCLPSAADNFGCGSDSSALESLAELDPATATPEELAAALEAAREAGLLGIDPFFPPTWTAPTDALDGLDPRQQAEGISAVINLTVTEGERADGAEPDLELVYKRVPVSLSPTPNHNPTITGWRVDGEPWSEGEGPLPVRSGATLSIEPILSADSLEAYTYENTAGEVEDREEEPFFTWFTEAGDFDQALSLYPEVAVEWTAPEALDTEALIVAVARDRRGGMAWRTLQVVVQ